MSGFFRPRNLFIAGGVVAALTMFPRTMAKHNPIGNVFETPAVKAVGDRHSAGGASNTHTPAVATPRGKPNEVVSEQLQSNGPGSAVHEQKMEQRAESGKLGKAFHQAHLGNDSGK